MKNLIQSKTDLIVFLLILIFVVSLLSLIATIVYNSIFIGCNCSF